MAFTGDKVVATSPVLDRQPTSGFTISTSYTSTLTGGVACGFAFTAPPSGVVEFQATAQMSNSTSGAYCFHSVQVRQGGVVGSGAIVFTPSDDQAACHNSTTVATRYTVLIVVVGLTAGATYNVQGMHKAGSGTATFVRKELYARPAP